MLTRVCVAVLPKKLFVGGLNLATTQQGLRDYFAQFGELEVSVCASLWEHVTSSLFLTALSLSLRNTHTLPRTPDRITL